MRGLINGGIRSEIQVKLNLAGNDLDIGSAQGYTRDILGADETIVSGAGIINVANEQGPRNAITIVKLPATAEWLSLTDDSGQEVNEACPDAITWNSIVDLGSNNSNGITG